MRVLGLGIQGESPRFRLAIFKYAKRNNWAKDNNLYPIVVTIFSLQVLKHHQKSKHREYRAYINQTEPIKIPRFH